MDETMEDQVGAKELTSNPSFIKEINVKTGEEEGIGANTYQAANTG